MLRFWAGTGPLPHESPQPWAGLRVLLTPLWVRMDAAPQPQWFAVGYSLLCTEQCACMGTEAVIMCLAWGFCMDGELMGSSVGPTKWVRLCTEVSEELQMPKNCWTPVRSHPAAFLPRTPGQALLGHSQYSQTVG